MAWEIYGLYIGELGYHFFVQSAITSTQNAIPRQYSVELDKLSHNNILPFVPVTPTFDVLSW